MRDADIIIFRRMKADLTLRYGTLRKAARELGCSVNGLRAAALGKCPGIRKRLREEAGLFTSENESN